MCYSIKEMRTESPRAAMWPVCNTFPPGDPFSYDQPGAIPTSLSA